jgi:N-sulfoglucosamine sulfohydrolase
MMRSKRILSAIFMAAWLAATSASWADDQDDKPLNVIVIFSDDHHYEALGAFGNEVIQTPHLDSLAQRGVMFTRAFSSNPICTPSRAIMYTGQDGWANNCYYFGRSIASASPWWPR